ncbi:STAS domain-containing protein [Alkalihalophilus pseudofirmus]|uniref:STAS domain-containing protein n=1 Tax=Alkalihalophilus pseudofirmus TaxID=79885 RepID=UPI00259B6805|nr:STAS domain-containing protein [Alkalihalophilus pseudofirmus]WEG16724.1 STAS domain-containing protein [Alkalihalophilus pseudofirmus]
MNDETYMNKEVEEFKSMLIEKEELIKDLSAPIIPSIIPKTILVPLTGALTYERFATIQEIILTRIPHEKADSVIIDFTAISYREVGDLGMEQLGERITQLRNSMRLMGVETIFTGFSSAFVQEIIRSGIDTSQLVVHSTFRTGLQYLMKKKGLALVEVGDK